MVSLLPACMPPSNLRILHLIRSRVLKSGCRSSQQPQGLHVHAYSYERWRPVQAQCIQGAGGAPTSNTVGQAVQFAGTCPDVVQ